jgi:hypothetical protein
MGLSLFLVVPLCVGATLGYTTPPRLWLGLLLSVFAIAWIVLILVTMGVAGIFCGWTLGLIFLTPTLLGCGVGWGLRLLLKGGSDDRRRYYCLGILAVLPFMAESIEYQFPPEAAITGVSTSATFPASPHQAWQAMLFYEQVRHPPPFLLTLALPRPLRSEGDKSRVGNVVHCVYQKGYLVKKITQVVEDRILGFQVVEQHLHFEHDVTLLDGSFILEPVDSSHVRVVLTTRYRRRLRPAFVWQPMEREVIRTMHEHVLEGMRLLVLVSTNRPNDRVPVAASVWSPRSQPPPIALRRSSPVRFHQSWRMPISVPMQKWRTPRSR